MHQDKKQHNPVLLREVMELLDPKKGNSYLDLTAGYGGHAKAVLDLTGPSARSVLVDRDPEAIKELHQLFDDSKSRILDQDFLSASKLLEEEGNEFDLILADLGVSSPHLNEGNRGFSIRLEGPLDMRMDQRQTLTAGDLVNQVSQSELTEIIKDFGEEPKASLIAKAIVKNRPITTTSKLAGIVEQVYHGKRGKIHPATKTFQALRIAVNNELGLLTDSLEVWLKLLSPGGRIAIISFHSLEDRIVKQFLKDHSGRNYDSDLELLTKHPIHPSFDEIVHNPRSRSSKLRAAVKIKRKGAS